MMHMWGKVYLDFDFRVYFSYNRFVISETHGVPFDSNVPVGVSTLHVHGQTLADVVGDGKQFATLTELFAHAESVQQSTGKPLYIYVDRAAYLELATRWFKSILPAATASTIQTIMHLHFLKEEAVAGVAGMGKGNDRPAMWHTKAATDITIAGLVNAFTEDPGFAAFYDTVKDRLSIEFLLPSFRAGAVAHKEAFLDSFYGFLSRVLRDEVYDWRRYVIANIQNPKMMELLSIPLDCFQIELVPAADPLHNARYWNRNGNFFAHSANPALMVDQMSVLDVQALQTLVQSLREPYDSSVAAPVRAAEDLIIDLLPFLVRGKVLEVEALQILADERFTANNLWSGDEVDKVNFFLVDKLLKNSPGELTEYVLR